MTNSLPFWIHSTHSKTYDSNVFIVKEKLKNTDNDGNVTWEDKLHYYNDPIRPYWITKEGCRNHRYKKEYEDEINLIKYKARDSELASKLKQNLGIFSRQNNIRKICNSPYVYGADIDTGVFIRQNLNKNTIGMIPQIQVGSIDIESEVRGEKRINVFSFNVGTEIYCAYLKEYLMKVDSKGNRIPATQEELVRVINEELKNEIETYHYNIHLFEAYTEIDLIVWVFQQIHRHKTDFVGVWNINFDIPKILERINAYGKDPKTILCHPEVPDKYKYLKYMEDTRQREHFTDKWHWFHLAGYTQFTDSMCLYARLRKAKGRDSSYTLDAIANKILGNGKIHFGKITNHYMEQTYNFMRYVAYNIKDTILIPLMEIQTKDHTSLLALTEHSMLYDFNKQTVLGKNSMFFYCRDRNKIIASVGEIMGDPYDDLLPPIGGTVLPPNKAIGIGINAVEEAPYLETQVSASVNDLDVTSSYPSSDQAFNIAKETKLATVINIEGFSTEHTEDYFSNVTSPKENAVYLGNKFFGLDDYTSMSAHVMEELTKDLIPAMQE